MPISTIAWILPRPRPDRYPGGFPLHFESKLLRLLNNPYPILQPFGGMAENGIRCDLDPSVIPDVIANAERLPFSDDTFGLVLCGPPYNGDYAAELYKTKEPKSKLWIAVAVRVCKPLGFIAVYHWYMVPRPRGANLAILLFIGTRQYHRPRVVSIYRKKPFGEL